MRHSMMTRQRVLLASLALLLGLGACAEPQADASPTAAGGHVHGLGVNPSDERLYVATHFGLFVLDEDELQRVGEAEHDLMGFAVAGPDSFWASGHPIGGELPQPMGLVRSDDNGQTWDQVSLGGEADLHSLDVEGEAMAAYDSLEGRVLTSDDAGQTFRTALRVPALDVVLDAEGDTIVARSDGALLRVQGSDTQILGDAPRLVMIDRSEEGLVGIGPDGGVWVSEDAGSWTSRGTLDGVPVALEVGGPRWYAATSTGLYVSDDEGSSWQGIG